VIDLDHTYRRLAGPWTADQLDARYRDAQRRGCHLAEGTQAPVARPIVALANAIPPSATINVAIHTLHLLPNANHGSPSQERVADELINTIDKCGATALHWAHRALELDGRAHGYTADEWLPTVYDITGRLLESAQSDSEPPSVVEAAQDTISWLACALAELDQDSAEVPTALAEALARLLTAVIFARRNAWWRHAPRVATTHLARRISSASTLPACRTAGAARSVVDRGPPLVAAGRAPPPHTAVRSRRDPLRDKVTVEGRVPLGKQLRSQDRQRALGRDQATRAPLTCRYPCWLRLPATRGRTQHSATTPAAGNEAPSRMGPRVICPRRVEDERKSVTAAAVASASGLSSSAGRSSHPLRVMAGDEHAATVSVLRTILD